MKGISFRMKLLPEAGPMFEPASHTLQPKLLGMEQKCLSPVLSSPTFPQAHTAHSVKLRGETEIHVLWSGLEAGNVTGFRIAPP